MWRCALSVQVDIVPTNSRRVLAVRFSNDDWQLLFLCVYMPYESDDIRTDSFIDELGYIECLINDNHRDFKLIFHVIGFTQFY